jgi:hexosaminidase
MGVKTLVALIATFVVMSGVFVSGAQARQSAAQPVLVIPTPQNVTAKNRNFTVQATTVIVLESGSARDQFTAQQINEELARWGAPPLNVVVADGKRALPTRCIFIGHGASDIGRKLLSERKGHLTPEMADEGYFLDADVDGVLIIAPAEKGRFYGAMTLLQLFQRSGSAVSIPGVSINDYPLHRMRGISDDISRGQVSTIDNFKKIIRFLARYKMNTYSLYLEDMFAFKNHPLIGKGRGALTAGELKELDAYARRYFVDIIPAFQTLGHCENLLSIPEYLGYAEYPGGRTLNVSDEKTYTLLDEMIGELCSSYSSPYFNMGADETRDVGLGATRERVERLGIAAVLAEHYRRVADIIRKYGKKPMIYGDILLKNQEILGMIPKDITIVDWDYDPKYRYESPGIFRKAGFPVLVLTALRSYRGPFIDHFNSFENIERFGRAGFEENSIGMVVSSWNDYGAEELRELNYYGNAWGAECAWQAVKPDLNSFNAAFFRDFFGTTDTRLLHSIFMILSSPSNSYTWYELWRHPMLPFMPTVTPKNHSPVIMERLQSIKSSMPLVLHLVKQAEATVRFNKDALQYLAFVARLNLWFALKVETEERVKELSHWAPKSQNKDSVASAITALCTSVLKGLAPLRTEFERLWRTTNKPEGLEYLLMRYDRQAAFWREKIEQVQKGQFWVDPEIESTWIYHADTTAGTKSPIRVQHAYFRKSFTVPKGVQSATIQWIGDTWVKLSVNGRAVGEVYVRRSNSLSAEHQRVKTFNIMPLLTESKNVISAEAQDYSVAGSAGLNVYGELRLTDGSIHKITSDSTWRVSASAGPQWKSISFDDSSWKHAISKTYPYSVDRPDFTTGRASWIEQ